MVAGQLTWSSAPDLFVVLLLGFLLLIVIDLALLVICAVKLAHDWRIGLTGLVVVAATWTGMLLWPAEEATRRFRVDLASSALVEDAERALDDPAATADMGPFVATSSEGSGRVVGWLIGIGFLGRGPGLVWDPDGVLDGDGFAQTHEGYPWFLYGTMCEPIVDDWLYCNMR